jgi:hypothetical protein
MPLGRRQFSLLLAGSPLVACGAPQTEPDPARQQLPPEPKPEPKPEPIYPKTPLERHVDALQARFNGRGWTIIAEPPFAVVGDGTPLEVTGHAAATIRWAIRQLEAAYFERPPAEIVTIYLFETAESYARHSNELIAEPPDTPYGYYSPTDHALVMNISTGGGTLVHEIVHPYVETNFPACPAWFNEGLASLYEQSAEVDGQIVGLTNWRLAGLQTALRDGSVPSFLELCETGDGFYSADPGSNYGQARYLCYWLQERGLLRRYYQDFTANCATDPTGYSTLVDLVGPDMDAFRATWETFVLALRFP